MQLCPIFCCEAVFCRLFQSIPCLHVTLHSYLIESRHPYFVSTGFQFYHFPFLVVFQHNCHFLKLECQPLNWARLGIIADRDCYLHQSSCFGLRQSPVVSAVKLSLVSCSCHYHTLQVCFFLFGDQQEIPKLIRKVRSLLSQSSRSDDVIKMNFVKL